MGATAEPDETMNSRLSWSVDGIDPSIRERAEAAARRAGMSFNEWIDSNLGDTPPNFRHSKPPSRDVADIHQRLDSITRQIEQISRSSPRSDNAREQGVARQLNDAISRLDARLSQISNPQYTRQAEERQHHHTDEIEPAVGQADPSQAYPHQVYPSEAYPPHAYRISPPLSPASLDAAVAEIAARQSELDTPMAPMPPHQEPPAAPASPVAVDFSSLEHHLFRITSQIETLQRPDHLEQSITAFRSELAEIRAAITEAMPRRAIEFIESEIRSLSRRIDDNRQNGIDSQALTNIEQALAEIREVLRSLMPAEQLKGYDEAIRNLGAKLDTILRANDDPATVQQLENAIAALRTVVANVASNDALERLSEDLHLLSSKVDQLARAGQSNDSFAVLEQRIAALTSAIEGREQLIVRDNSDQIESALTGLSDRIDRLQVGSDGASAFTHLEQRVSYLLERLEASNNQGGDFSRIEDGLQDILRHLERQHAAFANFAADQSRSAPVAPAPQDPELINVVKRELSDIRFGQTETDRHTQDSLEALHSTLGHVVDRLALIEGDLRVVRSNSTAPSQSPAPAGRLEVPQEATLAFAEPPPRPELPNPAAEEMHFAAAPREFRLAEALASTTPPALAINEILMPASAELRTPAPEPDLPPDHPLEPGTWPNGRAASPSERIAASESAISDLPTPPRGPVSTASFIAAARRAAQAAAAQPLADRPASKPPKAAASKSGRKSTSVTSKIRSLLVGASVVVIVLGSFKVAMKLLDNSSSQPAPVAIGNSGAAIVPPPTDAAIKPIVPDQVAPQMTPPTPTGRESLNTGAPIVTEETASVEIPQPATAAPATIPDTDTTGAIPSARGLAGVQVPPSERLPDAIGGPVLRSAAIRGDATAAYEVGLRFAEGKGVPQNFSEAAKWYDRAAQAGVVPAVFRLGTFYEKGLGVTKDVNIARRYYLQAAERGNAKAMHNLAVLDADGGGKGANYQSAADWFRKAADRGIADSQFNLGILYARGIGVEQNLSESFKWFSLAAAQGDADAAQKRDDVAKRLDAQSLAAARLAIQTFAAEPQPEDATVVATPNGGWDMTAPQANLPKTKPTKRASR